MEKVYLLSTVMKTRFIIASMKLALQDFLDSLVGQENAVVDLRDCKFAPICAGLLKSYYGKVKFQDSANPAQNEYLVRNAEAVQPRTVQRESIPIKKTVQTLMAYMQDMKPGIVYDVAHWDDDPASMKAFIILVSLSRPEITIDLQGQAKHVFAEIRRHWMSAGNKHSKYQELVGAHFGRGIVGRFEAIVDREVVDGHVYVPGEGTLELNVYLHEFYAIPSEIGKKRVVENPEYADLVDWAAQTLERKVASVPIMLNYIEKGG